MDYEQAMARLTQMVETSKLEPMDCLEARLQPAADGDGLQITNTRHLSVAGFMMKWANAMDEGEAATLIESDVPYLGIIQDGTAKLIPVPGWGQRRAAEVKLNEQMSTREGCWSLLADLGWTATDMESAGEWLVTATCGTERKVVMDSADRLSAWQQVVQLVRQQAGIV